MSARGASIHADHLGFTYLGSRVPTLAAITLEAAPGSETWITGPNAAGKSTLLAVFAGIIPTVIEGKVEGTLEMHADADGLPPVPAMVMQDAGVYLFRTVYDEVAFPLENGGVSAAGVEPAVRAALELVGISQLEGRLMHTLSGGERQKVAVAAALAVKPDLLLLDEPFEQLDPASADEVLALARARAREGATVVIATRESEHMPEGAARIHLVAGGRAAETVSVAPAHTRAAYGGGDVVLEMRAVTHRFGSGGGVDGVDLVVHAGEAVALLGPNGAGKTTLMKHAIGLLRPDSGTVLVLGEDIERKPVWELAREVGLLFQNPDDQVFNRVVETEVAWSLLARGVTKSVALERAHAVMAELGIGDLAQENPHEITASQRQRVAFASVLVAEPRVIILDEPTKALDAVAAETLAAAVDRRLSDGAGVLLVTHDLRFAARLADRCVVLADRKVVADAPAREVLANEDILRRVRLLPATSSQDPKINVGSRLLRSS
ncbi:MAG: ATP-binding cassette domain-containing protein [Actinomycetota bacterium]|nr:ATP-binding cassette domain-containing protein [Actinomycetota bacterium]MDP3631246.1 ATP-binding cassette domain-containing protein [Actinomycetota bacterium]